MQRFRNAFFPVDAAVSMHSAKKMRNPMPRRKEDLPLVEPSRCNSRSMLLSRRSHDTVTKQLRRSHDAVTTKYYSRYILFSSVTGNYLMNRCIELRKRKITRWDKVWVDRMVVQVMLCLFYELKGALVQEGSYNLCEMSVGEFCGFGQRV